jgi:hypothetical protein
MGAYIILSNFWICVVDCQSRRIPEGLKTCLLTTWIQNFSYTITRCKNVSKMVGKSIEDVNDDFLPTIVLYFIR